MSSAIGTFLIFHFATLIYNLEQLLLFIPKLVVFKEFGDSSINATLYFWIDLAVAGYFGALDGAVKGVKTALEQEGINIPFPIRTVYMEQVSG